MERIDINLDVFNKMKPLKKNVVHIHQNKLYKYSPESLNIVRTIDEFSSNPVFKSIAIPQAYLYDKQKYFGYIMKYYKKIYQVEQAIQNGLIKDIEKYALELLSIIEELNKLNLCYWDFHCGNILSNNKGHPFILDVDDMEYFPTNEDLHSQREYLSEFLLVIYLGKRKSIHSFAREDIIQKYFKNSTLEYLDTLGDLKEPVPRLPYCIIEELSDIDKRETIKSKIK